MGFNDIINKYLEEYNSQPFEKLCYEHYKLVEKNGYYYIFERNKIVGSGKTLKEVQERVDSIVSGC